MAPVSSGATVAVTGASGFIGSHVCGALLSSGYRVRAVVRDPADEAKAAHLLALPGAAGNLTLHAGLLDVPGSYDSAFEGADAVIHTAAVVEIGNVKDPDNEIVKPSVEGVKNVLASADKSSTVRRFVHTSSMLATLKWDGDALDETFSETSWNTASTVQNGDAYGFAKVQAERLVHEHTSSSYDTMVMLPGVNLGPCFTKAHTKASAVVVRQFLFGNQQPEYYAHFVDVRDAADGHVRALGLVLPEQDCRRFLLCSGDGMMVSALEQPLQKLYPALKINANPHPGPVLSRLLSVPLLWRLATSEFQRVFSMQRFSLDTSRSKSLLGVTYRPLDDTLRDTVDSMVGVNDFVKPRKL